MAGPIGLRVLQAAAGLMIGVAVGLMIGVAAGMTTGMMTRMTTGVAAVQGAATVAVAALLEEEGLRGVGNHPSEKRGCVTVNGDQKEL